MKTTKITITTTTTNNNNNNTTTTTATTTTTTRDHTKRVTCQFRMRHISIEDRNRTMVG